MPVPTIFGAYTAQPGTPPVVPTAWNPADKNASIALSGGNLIATLSPGGGFVGVRAVASKTTGKYYDEMTNNTGSSGGGSGLGWATAAWALSGVYLGQSSTGLGYLDDGTVRLNNVIIGGGDSWTNPGDVVRMATDIGAKLLWVGRVGSGLWNSSGTANPATGVGGISFAGIAAGALFPASSMFYPSQQDTANFGATAFAGFLPSGFSLVT